MRFPDIETSVRLHNFSAIRVHAIDRNMEMIIVRIVVQPIDSLVSGQTHPFKKNIQCCTGILLCADSRALDVPPFAPTHV